jgi:hypothetical protein
MLFLFTTTKQKTAFKLKAVFGIYKTIFTPTLKFLPRVE